MTNTADIGHVLHMFQAPYQVLYMHYLIYLQNSPMKRRCYHPYFTDEKNEPGINSPDQGPEEEFNLAQLPWVQSQLCRLSVLVKMLSNTSYLSDASTPGCPSGRLDSLGSRLRSEAGRVRVKVWSRIRTAGRGGGSLSGQWGVELGRRPNNSPSCP